MVKPVLKNIKKLTNNKWANMYEYDYEYNNHTIHYYVSSRRPVNVKNAKDAVPQTVVVLPYFKKDGKIFIVYEHQFRYAVNDYIYDLAAGLIDEGETPEEAMQRELKEELGATCVSYTLCSTLAYTTPGCLNETSITYFAEVMMGERPNLQDDELIEPYIVPLEECIDFVDTHIMGVQGKMMTKIFYYQQKCK